MGLDIKRDFFENKINQLKAIVDFNDYDENNIEVMAKSVFGDDTKVTADRIDEFLRLEIDTGESKFFLGYFEETQDILRSIYTAFHIASGMYHLGVSDENKEIFISDLYNEFSVERIKYMIENLEKEYDI